jgi:hypothetical protein
MAFVKLIKKVIAFNLPNQTPKPNSIRGPGGGLTKHTFGPKAFLSWTCDVKIFSQLPGIGKTRKRHACKVPSLLQCGRVVLSDQPKLLQRSGALVKTACMPRVRESEPLKIEMVAELVAEGTKECSERGDLFPHRRARPYPDRIAWRNVRQHCTRCSEDRTSSRL